MLAGYFGKKNDFEKMEIKLKLDKSFSPKILDFLRKMFMRKDSNRQRLACTSEYKRKEKSVIRHRYDSTTASTVEAQSLIQLSINSNQ